MKRVLAGVARLLGVAGAPAGVDSLKDCDGLEGVREGDVGRAGAEYEREPRPPPNPRTRAHASVASAPIHSVSASPVVASKVERFIGVLPPPGALRVG
jgi:hypothetical protein